MSTTQSTTSAAPAIEFDDVSLRFISGDGTATVTLRNFTMAVARGEFVAIVGPTGCGKSTTLNMITGLLQPTVGRVQVMNQPVTGIDPRIGFVFQADAVFPWRNVIDNVAAGPMFRGTPHKQAHELAAQWITRVGLEGFARHYPHQLSGGMRKRVALAQTFINNPEILLMDEPTASLDPASAERVRGWLSDYQRRTGATMLLASHNMFEVERLCSEVLMMKQGRIVDRGAPSRLIQRYGRENLEQVFIDIARDDAL